MGVYLPPDGCRPVGAMVAEGGRCLLYDNQLGLTLPPRFVVTPEGRISNWHGEQMEWVPDDLIDTGETRRLDELLWLGEGNS